MKHSPAEFPQNRCQPGGWRIALFIAFLACGGLRLPAQIPVAGVPVPELAVLDTQMTQFMQSYGISAASLSVMRNGTPVFHHVYGWQDRAKTISLRPDALFRVASVTKPFTAAAVRKLIANGKITLNSRVFSLGVPGAGILDHVPFGTLDARLGDITVGHLLMHRGGWDRAIAGDLTYMEKTIAAAMGVTSPPGRDATVRYIMGQPLQFAPGTTSAYSNIGYLLLGLIIEKVSGQSYESFIQQNVIGLDGSTTADWHLGRTFAADQSAREPFYDEPVQATNVFYPAFSTAPTVERPYGSFDMEARTGQGRIVTHGLVVLRYLNRFQVAGDAIGSARPAPGSWRWNHTGEQAGASSLARQRGDGINFAVMFNKRVLSGSDYSSLIRTQLDSLFDSGTIQSWPSANITQLPVPVPTITIAADPPQLTCPTVPGRHYQWQSSSNLTEWSDLATPFIGTGSTAATPISFSGADRMFYRVVVRQ